MPARFQRIFVWAALLIGTLSGGGVFSDSAAFAQEPEELLPAETVFYLHADGINNHLKAFKETAAYQAVYKSGLASILAESLAGLSGKMPSSELNMSLEHLNDYGFSLAIAVDPPSPGPLGLWGTIVVPEAGEGVDVLADLISSFNPEKLEVLSTRVQGRNIRFVKVPNAPIDIGWWQEGQHLVITFGMDAIASEIAVATGKRKNLTEGRLYDQYAEPKTEFELTTVLWFDFKALSQSFAEIPVPLSKEKEPVPVKRLIEILGLETLDHVGILAGFRDAALWSEVTISAPGERKGLMSLIDQPTFTLEDLPGIPLHHLGVVAKSFDWGPAYSTLSSIVREIAALTSDEAVAKIESNLQSFEDDFGFRPEDLFNSLGSLNCLYVDAGQGSHALGSVIVISLNDAKVFADCADKLLARLQKEANMQDEDALRIIKNVEEGETQIRLQLPKFPILSPTLSVQEGFLILGAIPQATRAQSLRMSGDLYSWSFETDLSDALELLPEEVTSVVISDPSQTYREFFGWVPFLAGFMELGLRSDGKLGPDQSLPLNSQNFPPAELITEPLFLNVTVSTVDESGLEAISRISLP